jgi:hypothetical protein
MPIFRPAGGWRLLVNAPAARRPGLAQTSPQPKRNSLCASPQIADTQLMQLPGGIQTGIDPKNIIYLFFFDRLP